MRRIALLLALCMAVALPLTRMRGQGPGPAGLHLSGDCAPGLEAQLPSGLALARDPEAAAVEAILLDDWFKTRHIPGADALCGPDCVDPAALVRIVTLRPGGSRKTLLLNTTGIGGLDCLIRAIDAETAALRPRPPACLAGKTVHTRWNLPFGLGAF